MSKRATKIVILVVAAFLVGLMLTNNYVLDYVGGQINYRLSLMFLFMSLSCLPLLLVVMAAVFLIFALCKRTWSKVTIIVCVVPSVLIIGMLVGFFGSAFFGEPGAVTFLRGFEKWAVRNVDTGAIQEWLVRAPESYWGDPCEPYGKFYWMGEELPKELPSCFTEFKPQHVIFERSELDGSRIVRFGWGGAMSHWGVVVGNPEMKMPSERKIETSEGLVHFQKPIKAGVYIFDEG